MDRVLYRKLARKSKMNFGKYADLTVEDLLYCVDAGGEYLRWCYFNLSGISFLDEILDELGITPEWRFEKPGTRPEAWDEFIHQIRRVKFNKTYGSMSESEKKAAFAIRKNKGLSERRAKCVQNEMKMRETPGSLQWKNQGHKKGDK